MIRVRQSGVAGYVLTHVDDMLAAGDIPILHLFVDAKKKERGTAQSKIIGPRKESDITYTGVWIAAMCCGGFGIHQCPYVSDVLKSWGMSECRQATTLGSRDSWKQQVSTFEVPDQTPLQSDVRLAQKCAGAMLWLSTRSRLDLSDCVSRMASLCSKDPLLSLMGKTLSLFLSGTCDHGLCLKSTSAFVGSSTVTMYGDASLETGVGYNGLVGQINGATVVWRSMRQSLDAFSTIETEAQALVDLMLMAEVLSSLLTSMGLPHGVPQLCCDDKGAIALTQGEGNSRTKTLVAKMRAIRSLFQAGYITVSYIETTKMLADILTKFLGPNPTRDALKSLGVVPFHQENGSTFHEWNVLHGYGMFENTWVSGPIASLW